MAFDAVHMEGSDWTQAQRQIRLWNKYLLPKIEELPGPSVFFPAGIRERMEGWDRNEHRYFDFQCSCPDISNPLWKVVTYIRLCQLMPILPSASVPWYFVNLVCKNKADKILLAENLRVFLEAHFQNDPIIKGKVRQSQRLPMDKMFEKESHRAIPVIFLLEKQKEIDQLCDAVSVDDGVSKKSQNHPFRDIIPICIWKGRFQVCWGYHHENVGTPQENFHLHMMVNTVDMKTGKRLDLDYKRWRKFKKNAKRKWEVL